MLRDTAITPNQVTLCAMGVCWVAATAFVAWPGWLGLIVAGVLYQVSYVLDCADGQLARVRGSASILGSELDFLTDELKAYFIWAAVAIRLWRFGDGSADDTTLMLGLVGLVLLASNLSLTKFLRNPVFPQPPAANEGRSFHGGPLAFANWLGKWLIQYPRYLLVVCLLGHVEIYFFVYLAAQALLCARSFMRVTLAVGRR